MLKKGEGGEVGFFFPLFLSLFFRCYIVDIFGRHASVIMTVQLISRMTFLDFGAKADTQSEGGAASFVAAVLVRVHENDVAWIMQHICR